VGWCDRPPPGLTVSIWITFALFFKLRFAIERQNLRSNPSSDCPCFLPVKKTTTKCTQTYHFGDKNIFSVEGPSPLHHIPLPLTPTAPRRLLAEILNAPCTGSVYLLFFLLFPVVSTSYLVNKDVHKYVYSSKRLAYEFCTDISNSFYRFVLYRFFVVIVEK